MGHEISPLEGQLCRCRCCEPDIPLPARICPESAGQHKQSEM